jgi:hypothetical protein
MLPVDPLTVILLVVPVKLNTPVLFNVTDPLGPVTVPPPLIPVPGLTVTLVITRLPLSYAVLAYIAPLIPTPPVTTTVPDPVPVDVIAPVNVTPLLAVKLVKPPVEG